MGTLRTYYSGCIVERRALITRGTLNMSTSEYTAGSKDWVIKACDTPLFSVAERTDGVCKSCLSGWTHPENYATDHGAAVIVAVQSGNKLPPLSLNQVDLLRRAGENGTYIMSQTVRRARSLEALGLLKLEDNGSMRVRGMNRERWFVQATGAGIVALARIQALKVHS